MERSKSAVSSINPHSVVQMDAFNHHALGAINSNYTNPAVSMAEGNNSEAFGKNSDALISFMLGNAMNSICVVSGSQQQKAATAAPESDWWL